MLLRSGSNVLVTVAAANANARNTLFLRNGVCDLLRVPHARAYVYAFVRVCVRASIIIALSPPRCGRVPPQVWAADRP